GQQLLGTRGLLSVRDTGIEPVTSSVSGKRATAAPIAQIASDLLGTPIGVYRGDDGIRTRVRGFAGRCLASRPRHRVGFHALCSMTKRDRSNRLVPLQ